MIYFKTERLMMRQLERSDIDEFHNMQSNYKVMKHTVGRAKTREENERELENIIEEYNQIEPSKIIMGISTISDDSRLLIGACAVINHTVDSLEVGYRLLEEHWGKGYGLETLEGLLRHCLIDLRAKKVRAEVNKENIYSIRLLEKSSMKFIEEYEDESGTVYVYMAEGELFA
ncbi:GNAT family N-acetyltransferase [Halobacillus massiliensis]|uniref:GNAT family N-acetyltransferase n=1 Tax=Halobacillus massiliensis TaxID=1926286 RepID=UPI0009E2A760|nr:GNAT family N-acetyltransferase [Halobacillus massiliensis]